MGPRWFAIRLPLAVTVGDAPMMSPKDSLAYQGAIHPPGGDGYYKSGRRGATLELPALPKSVFVDRAQVAEWLRIMDEMEAQHKQALNRELKTAFAALGSSAMTGSNRQEVKDSRVPSKTFSIGPGAIEWMKSWDEWVKKNGELAEPKPAISTEETLELTLPSCTANPSCGEDDVICPQCKAGNCPGAKCWRGCNG